MQRHLAERLGEGVKDAVPDVERELKELKAPLTLEKGEGEGRREPGR